MEQLEAILHEKGRRKKLKLNYDENTRLGKEVQFFFHFRKDREVYYIYPGHIQTEPDKFFGVLPGKTKNVVDICVNSRRSMGKMKQKKASKIKIGDREYTFNGVSMAPILAKTFNSELRNQLTYLTQGKYFRKRVQRLEPLMALALLGCGGLVYRILMSVLAKWGIFL